MSLSRRLLASGRIARRATVAAVMIGVAAAALAVAQAGLLARTIAGAFMGGEEVAGLAVPLAALALVLAARAVLAWLAEITARRISGSVKSDLRSRLLARAVGAGPRWSAGNPSGEVVLVATRGLDALDGYFGRYLPQLGLAVTVPLVVVACLFAVDAVAGLTVLLTVPLIPVFMVLVGRMSAAHRARRWAALTRLAHRFTDVVAGLPTLRAYGRAAAQVEILRRITDTYRTTTMATLRVAFLSALVLELLATISVALVAVGIGLRLDAGGMTLEVGLFALILAPEAYLPLRRLGSEYHASEEGLAAAGAAFAIIDAPQAPRGRSVPVPPGPLALVVEDLWVEQPGRDVAAPAGLSLVVRAGEVVAITGPSGAGKSTLLEVILGMGEPSAGRVLVTVTGGAATDGDATAGAANGEDSPGRSSPDGSAPDGSAADPSAADPSAADPSAADPSAVDVRDLDIVAWRGCVAWVPQSSYLFAGSVAENVRLGAPDAGDPDVASALAAVGLGDLAPSLALGERGRGLSSGQRRRVGVARALVRRARVLLLDEPTAGLDEAAEEAVLAAIRAEAARGAAVLLVAHRPGAVAGADRAVEVRWIGMAPATPGVTMAPGSPGGQGASGPAPAPAAAS